MCVQSTVGEFDNAQLPGYLTRTGNACNITRSICIKKQHT